MATGILLVLLGIWLFINAINGNFGNVLAGNLKIGQVSAKPGTIP